MRDTLPGRYKVDTGRYEEDIGRHRKTLETEEIHRRYGEDIVIRR